MVQQGEAIHFTDEFTLSSNDISGYVFTLIPDSGQVYKFTGKNTQGGFDDIKVKAHLSDLNGNTIPSLIQDEDSNVKPGDIIGPDNGVKIKLENTAGAERTAFATVNFLRIK